jgi:hypothetical protein
MILSAEDRLAIKNKKICWVCKGEFEEGTKGKGTRVKKTKKMEGRGKSATTITCGRKYLQGVVIFVA